MDLHTHVLEFEGATGSRRGATATGAGSWWGRPREAAACVVEDFVFVEGGGGGGGAGVFGRLFFDAVVLVAALAAAGAVSSAVVDGVGGGVVGGAGAGAGEFRGEFVGVFVYVGFAAVGVGAQGGGFHEEAAGGGLVAGGVVAVGVGGTARLGCGAGCAYSGLFLGYVIKVKGFWTEWFRRCL